MTVQYVEGIKYNYWPYYTTTYYIKYMDIVGEDRGQRSTGGHDTLSTRPSARCSVRSGNRSAPRLVPSAPSGSPLPLSSKRTPTAKSTHMTPLPGIETGG